MITPEKTYSSNPFVDNIIYYAKLLAMNCTIKDEEEALAGETKESLYAGDLYISCVEGRATYEMFKSIPEEILDKYIITKSNLDSYVNNVNALKTKLNTYTPTTRRRIITNLSKLARTVYIDHFETMSSYVESAGYDWLQEKQALYNKCKHNEADYKDLFDELPIRTTLRIIKTYLNSHGYLDLAVIWDPESKITKADLEAVEEAIKAAEESGEDYEYDTSVRTMLLDTDYVNNTEGYNPDATTEQNQFNAYIHTRDDDNIIEELANISRAMRDVFISHYDTMKNRKYFTEDVTNNTTVNDTGYRLPAWLGYIYDAGLYEKCKNNKATYRNIYDFLPKYALDDILYSVLGDDVDTYMLNSGLNMLEIYFNQYADNVTAKKLTLNSKMMADYLANYQLYLNNIIYFQCKNDVIDFFGLYDYFPEETLKSIIATEIEEVTNLHNYSLHKTILNSYLASLDPTQAQNIRDNITKDMLEWYPKNHVETNNYYRALIGLPPMDSKGNVYEDTLYHTYDANWNISRTTLECRDL